MDKMGMKTWGIFILILIAAVPAAHSKDLELAAKAGEFDVRARIDRNPPIVGSNHMEIEIKDSAAGRVTDANVMVNYYMPPMPRMAPMNYSTSAELKGEKYRATMDLIMAGPWIIRVLITRDGKKATAKFNIDAQ
ncbi:MAG: copper resistance protein [Deltaproteobacteria bacterium]|nr:copper resistance protein [Deltaproteobacteria bacterium]